MNVKIVANVEDNAVSIHILEGRKKLDFTKFKKNEIKSLSEIFLGIGYQFQNLYNDNKQIS